ncbi:SAM-dependent methyltransferase TehB [Streptococcus loxodontisalivarius]|uniref:Tellurite methyltransferase n=1 Tax=Streptococcus loxodontisalivarius TaxID=1349415 RepID=A0ABS2PSF8_9STRE|nr:SAM-dependent methyltransferase TehB [Streptococcus loxodontisalivarius]MBM7642976.1 tellurite methyltransferase [Streptococcus loxodontisalivarius]
MTSKNLVLYKRMPNWTGETMPEAIKRRHNTKVGTWGKLTILSGELKFYEMTEDDQITAEHIFTKDSDIPFVEPQAWHKVEALTDDLEFYLEFYCQLEDYLNKKHGWTKTHSEVIEAAPLLSPKSKILDLGCGQGRNSLYLSMLGHDVTSVDANGQSLVMLENMAMEEDIPAKIDWYDINEANITDTFDFILSTVVFMFLDREQIPHIIQDMQDHTKIGGYNLIVCAMDTENYPCPMPFSFTFKEGELKDYYKDWELVKYNENVGQLHKVDENGNRIQLQFATMLAKKVK